MSARACRAVFDLARPDAVAGAGNDIVGAADKPDITFSAPTDPGGFPSDNIPPSAYLHLPRGLGLEISHLQRKLGLAFAAHTQPPLSHPPALEDRTSIEVEVGGDIAVRHVGGVG